MVLKRIDVSVAYAILSRLGTVLIELIGIVLIIIGAIGLYMDT